MSLVTLKNQVSQLFDKKQSSDTSILNNNNDNNVPYGSISDEITFSRDRTQEIVNEEFETYSQSNSASSEKSGMFNNIDPRVMSDIIIGLSDGLTVPFALTAGLSSLGDSKLVITGGMAELVSGAISMGLGGFLAARSELEYYKSEVKKEKQQFFDKPDNIIQEVADIMIETGAQPNTVTSFIRDMEKNPRGMIDFIIRFGKGLEEPAEGRQLTSALTIGLSYFFGGFIPLLPYFFTEIVKTGLIVSVIVMIITLFCFGYVKTAISLGADSSLSKRVSEGFQMILIGSLAAGAAWTLVYFIE